ncbi:MAG TPA: phosphate ABC transporter substrate-binding protein [Candidatus Pullilachnospira intestinigallinarum]|nr:phosphate ABC transporter substrate-binding protein [Candidatus Pullilachnospira intestinigallinarum]
MKLKKVAAIFAACVMGMSLAACGGKDAGNADSGETTESTDDGAAAETTEEPTGEAAEDLSGAIATGGSTSVEDVIGSLSEAFMEEYPDVDITYDPNGSGAGITGAADGTYDLGLSSRDLTDEETGQGLVATTFALDGIAIVVHPDNTVTDLTMDNIKALATGEITNWSEVGGPDAPVILVGREAGSGTRDGFESIVDVKDSCVYEQELTSTGAVMAAVAANPNAFGYVSLSAVDDTVKMVTVDGVEASEATVQDGSYKIQRPFIFVTKDGEELSAQAQAFVDFATSDAASDLIAGAGAVPLA